MEKFENYEQYVDIIKQAQNNNMKNINCYLMPSEIMELIELKKLFYIRNDKVLQIVVVNDRYIKISWYAKDNLEYLPVETTLPIVTDLPYNKTKSDRFEKISTMLQNIDFVLNCSVSRMSNNSDEACDPAKNIFDLNISTLQESEIDTVYKIWEDNFDSIRNLLYSKNEIKTNIDNIYVCKDKESNIVGAMEVILGKTFGMIQHIAVDKKYQGKGIGSIMESFYINKCKSLGIKNLLLYTIDDNISAQNFHKKFGFSFDGKHNCQFILRRKIWTN